MASASLLLGALWSCAPSEPNPAHGSEAPRVVVIGIDGADWKLIDALSTEGRMPHLSGLRAGGVWGEIETTNDIALSPVIWTSVATGKTAAKHGITWFMVDRPDGTRVPVRSSNRRTEALWTILAQRGLRAGVVGWWATYPAEDVGEGKLVSDALGFHGFGATARGGDDARKTHPSALFDRMDALVPPEQQVSAEFAQRFLHVTASEYREEMFDPARFPRRDPMNPIHLFQEYAVTAQGYTAISEELLEEGGLDLFMVYFEQVDSFSHLFMKHAPPRLEWIDEAEHERYRDVVTEWYVYQDELLGRLLERIDLERTAVIVLSDHGFKSGERRIRSEELVDVRKAHLDHETHGILVATGPGIRGGGAEIRGASVLDITPTVLHYLGLPVGKDMDGKVLEQVFDEAFRAERPIEYVRTYEGARDGKAKTAPDDLDEFDAAELAALEGGLEALGYAGGEEEASGDSESASEESSPEMRNNMGRIHLRNGELEKALREFQAALELAPNNAEALLNIGSIHRARGNEDLALHFVKRALQVDPNSIGALSQLAEIRLQAGDHAEAIRLFREALAIDDSQPFLHLGLGDVLQRAGFFEEAARVFHGVLELEPDSFKARYNLGVTCSNQGRVEEGRRWYEEALELEPDHPEAVLALNNLGAILLSTGDREAALSRFEEALEAGPFHMESRFNAALIHLDRGNLERGIELLEAASALQPDHEQVHERLGMTYLFAGRAEDALRALLLVYRLHASNWVAPVGIAVLHARAGQEERAQAALAAAIERGGERARAQAAEFPALEPLLDR